jgi:hypothetical protein
VVEHLSKPGLNSQHRKKKSRELVVKYLGLITNKMKIRFDTSKSLERETLEKG